MTSAIYVLGPGMFYNLEKYYDWFPRNAVLEYYWIFEYHSFHMADITIKYEWIPLK